MEFIDPELLAYCESHTSEEDPLLKKIVRETQAKVLMPRMISGHLQGKILELFVKMLRPKTILEIGTYTGYSTICLAEGLSEKGIIQTIDSNEELVSIQKEFFEKSNYNQNIQTHLGKAIDVLPKLDGLFDLVYIDADKVNYAMYFDIILPKMKKGGLIISDNVLWSGKVLENTDSKDKNTKALQIYNDKLKSDPRIQTILLPFRDGLSLSWIR